MEKKAKRRRCRSVSLCAIHLHSYICLSAPAARVDHSAAFDVTSPLLWWRVKEEGMFAQRMLFFSVWLPLWHVSEDETWPLGPGKASSWLFPLPEKSVRDKWFLFKSAKQNPLIKIIAKLLFFFSCFLLLLSFLLLKKLPLFLHTVWAESWKAIGLRCQKSKLSKICKMWFGVHPGVGSYLFFSFFFFAFESQYRAIMLPKNDFKTYFITTCKYQRCPMPWQKNI